MKFIGYIIIIAVVVFAVLQVVKLIQDLKRKNVKNKTAENKPLPSAEDKNKES